MTLEENPNIMKIIKGTGHSAYFSEEETEMPNKDMALLNDFFPDLTVQYVNVLLRKMVKKGWMKWKKNKKGDWVILPNWTAIIESVIQIQIEKFEGELKFPGFRVTKAEISRKIKFLKSLTKNNKLFLSRIFYAYNNTALSEPFVSMKDFATWEFPKIVWRIEENYRMGQWVNEMADKTFKQYVQLFEITPVEEDTASVLNLPKK